MVQAWMIWFMVSRGTICGAIALSYPPPPPLLFGLMLTVAVTLIVTLGEYKRAIDSTQFA